MSSDRGLLGQYELLRPIGRGGMASVWLARDTRTGRAVAVKRMRRDVGVDRSMARAFADEAALGLRLRHPNIVEAIERGEATDELGTEHYLVLELLRGRTAGQLLRVSLDRREPLPLGVALGIVRDVARGLDHAHRLTDRDGSPLGIIHRDVNPRNVFVCESGIAKIIDFGIAKANRRSQDTEQGTIRGTLGYLAPEQLHGREVDARVDVFALGLIAYELLTGIHPMRGENDAETLFRLLEQDVPSPETLRPEVPAAIGAIVLRALMRDRDRRLPSAGAVADTIEASAAHEGIAIGPEITAAHLGAMFRDEATRSAALAVVAQPPLAQGGATPRAHRPRLLVRAALAAGALSLAALAAASTAHLFRRSSDPVPATQPAAVVPAAPPVAPVAEAPVEKIPEIAAPRLPATQHPKAPKRRVRSDCVVYLSLTKGPTTVCPGRTKPAKHPRR